MVLNSLYLSNYRNYREMSISFSKGTNIVLGRNAQGKTNLLESLFFLSCAKSFRAKKEKELILFGENHAAVKALIQAYDRNFSVDIEIFPAKKRKIYVNGIIQKRVTDYVGLIRTVLFSPDDLSMIKEGPSLRRRFVDIAISQLKPAYIKLLAEHNKIIEHKGKIFKGYEKKPELLPLLDVFNIKLSQKFAEIIAYRAEFAECLNNYMSGIFKDMSSGEDGIKAVYKTDSAVNDVFDNPERNSSRIYEHLCKRMSAEKESKQCLIGAQRDDVEIFINGKAARNYASQGQIRSAVLAMKLAERDIFKDKTGENPVLLLDDVLSELDNRRRDYLLNSIKHGQIFITSCNESISTTTKNTRLFIVENGVITEKGEK